MARDTAAIRTSIDCREVYAELVPHGVIRGKTARCPNPAHDDAHPSASLDAAGWHCHACDSRGDAIAMVQLVKGLEFGPACDWLEARASLPRSIKRVQAGRVDLVLDRYLELPSPERKRTMRELWDVLAGRDFREFGPAASGWLASRGIDQDTAAAAGVRDWTRRAKKIVDLARGWSTEDRLASGLFSARGAWFPLEKLRDGEAHGVAIPCWHPSVPWPVAWRWRWSRPVRIAEREVKAHAMFGAVYPLGQQSADPWTIPPCAADLVIVAEGEPDWLSFCKVVREHDRLRDFVAVVGICDVASGWRVDLLGECRAQVLVAVHANRSTAALVKGAERVLGHRRVSEALLSEAADANDLLRSGSLVAWLEAQKCLSNFRTSTLPAAEISDL